VSSYVPCLGKQEPNDLFASGNFVANTDVMLYLFSERVVRFGGHFDVIGDQ
jgi:hypothetical protein